MHKHEGVTGTGEAAVEEAQIFGDMNRRIDTPHRVM